MNCLVVMIRTQAREGLRPRWKPQPTIPIVPVEDRSLHPRQNIYLRPVQAADVAGILVSPILHDLAGSSFSVFSPQY